MSLNKYMHPRNIYKNPPNFKELAIRYPDFRKHAKQDVTGKITIDFKDQEALRMFTTTLLKKDFGLEVEIPSGRLIPTLPLRLNYLLWIEDLLAQLGKLQKTSVRGIDIGTGASCIYPLLAAKKNGWYMLATETDCENADAAKSNVEHNKLQNLVKVQLVDRGVVLMSSVEMDEKYDFCMCNPPFFKSVEELDQRKKSRKPQRPPPHNAPTGSVEEVVVPGGEVALITQIMEESLQLRNNVRLYTTMIGVKTNLRPLKNELQRHGITNFTTTEFCQGHTTRWGLVWSFSDQLCLQETSGKPNHKKIKPMVYTVPPTSDPDSCTVEAICGRVQDLLNKLKIKSKEIKRSVSTRVLDIIAEQNTWSHQRRLRREMQKKHEVEDSSMERKNDESFSLAGSPSSEKVSSDAEHQTYLKTKPKTTNIKETLTETVAASIEVPQKSSGNEWSNTQSELTTQSQHQKRKLEKTSADPQMSAKKIKSDSLQVKAQVTDGKSSVQSGKNSDAAETSTALNALLVVRKEEQKILIEVTYVNGSSGKDGVHQVLQYIRNNLK